MGNEESVKLFEAGGDCGRGRVSDTVGRGSQEGVRGAADRHEPSSDTRVSVSTPSRPLSCAHHTAHRVLPDFLPSHTQQPGSARKE